ncbi:MAG: capsular biosynthesis protein [Clostridia bacterium]|jgi:protein-tyrosine phosphatase|nr:capsular biosynthesis protein [Clostridia bacterium]
MYDIHSHLLPGVDDGAATIEEAVEITYAAEKAGVKAIVCTPHFMGDSYKSSAANNLSMLSCLREAVEQKGIGIELYLGNEVHINPEIIKLLDAGIISTINNSRYILIELPVLSKPIFTDDILFKLRLRGLVPVIAHPERYVWVMRKPKELSEIIRMGCLIQLNIASISGCYGDAARRAAKALLRENSIHLLGSDSHTSTKIYDSCKADLRLLKKLSSEYKVGRIIENTEAVVYNQVIL